MKDDGVYLKHVKCAIERIERYTREGESQFFADPKTQDAVVRNLEIIGEAIKQLSERLRADNSQVPWRQIGGMRDKLIHEYFGVNLALVWDVVVNHLPTLLSTVDRILEEERQP